MSFLLQSVLTFCLSFLTVVIFIGATILAASDAQGAFVYILALPLCMLLLALGYFFSHRRSLARKLVVLEVVFVILFVVSSFVPSLQVFPRSVMEGVAGGFERVTGMTPYAWNKQLSAPVPGK